MSDTVTNKGQRTTGCIMDNCGWPWCDCAPPVDGGPALPSSHNDPRLEGTEFTEQEQGIMAARDPYSRMVQICGMLRKLHLTHGRPSSELAIEVDPDVFARVFRSMPQPLVAAQHVAKLGLDEIEVAGVIVRRVDPGTRERELDMLKRGFGKVWAIGKAK